MCCVCCSRACVPHTLQVCAIKFRCVDELVRHNMYGHPASFHDTRVAVPVCVGLVLTMCLDCYPNTPRVLSSNGLVFSSVQELSDQFVEVLQGFPNVRTCTRRTQLPCHHTCSPCLHRAPSQQSPVLARLRAGVAVRSCVWLCVRACVQQVSCLLLTKLTSVVCRERASKRTQGGKRIGCRVLRQCSRSNLVVYCTCSSQTSSCLYRDVCLPSVFNRSGYSNDETLCSERRWHVAAWLTCDPQAKVAVHPRSCRRCVVTWRARLRLCRSSLVT